MPDDGLLRARAHAREVRLAEVSCTEGCCGALHVTIRRDGDQVVREDRRRTAAGPGGPGLPSYRFDARLYDAEVARAGSDRSWSWPARTVARPIGAGPIERPDLLGRWDARPGRVGTGLDDPGTTVVTFWYLPGPASGTPERPDRALRFSWDIPDDGTAPGARAAAALRRPAEEDPRPTRGCRAEARGGP
ncbi:hypothetical protein ACFXAF_10570 [Kitasatospora sp. NPDC059463]|uniref:hypothetical protein n=1 Tax=unclassified Kitasatospora TaxID=2633591 RepID=UPI00368C23D2